LEKLNSIKGAYVVVGESFSGPIAVFLAARNLPGLLGIILVATFIKPPYFSFLKYLPWTFIFTMARPLYKSIIALSPFAKGNILRAASVELLKVKPRVLAARVNAALTVDATGSLEETKIPVAYLRARYDLVVPPWNLKKIIAIKPTTEVISFNCQHFLLQSVPHAAWQTIDNLCRKFADYHRSSN
jgi:pimeloyl-ACP methyl ester carboxylesterase